MLPVILALDTKDLDLASKWIKSSADQIDHFKVGLEFYLLHGFEGIKKLQQVADFKLFLDLKLYDIPNTVKGAVESVSVLNPKFLTVHASGGPKMIQAASKALPNGLITAVTVLTSFSEDEFAKTPGVRVEGDELSDQVRVMTPKDAISAGADFVVIGRSITGQWDGSDLKMRKKIELISNSLG